ncbi:MAG: hypothetical protein AB8B40_09440, partial [Prochlorococcus sp.]
SITVTFNVQWVKVPSAQAELSLRASVEPVFNSANTPWQGRRPCHGVCQIQDMLDLLNNT